MSHEIPGADPTLDRAVQTCLGLWGYGPQATTRLINLSEKGCVANFFKGLKRLPRGYDYAASAANCWKAGMPLAANWFFRIM